MPKKPHWFKPLDALSFGLAAVLVVAASIWVTTAGIRGEALALMWVVALTFVAIYGRLLWLRKKFIDEWEWEPTFGLMVKRNGLKADLAELAVATRDSIYGWGKHFGESAVRRLIMENVIWVVFNKDLDTHPPSGKVPMEGYTVVRSFAMMVDFDDPSDPVIRTAYQHELGHVIQGHITGEWDQDTHHKKAKELGLP